MKNNKTHIVILGAGYGGVVSAQGLVKLLGKHNIKVTLINKHLYHQIITQLHEPASGHAYADDIRVPLSKLIDKRINLFKGVVSKIEPKSKKVTLEDHTVIDYDHLIVALGSDPEYFNIPGLREYSYPLRSLNAARMIKVHIEGCLARYKVNPQETGLLNFVVGGAGFTGIEIAGELAEWLPKVTEEFDVTMDKVKLICAEASPQVLPGFDPELAKSTEEILLSKGIDLRLTSPIDEVGPDFVKIKGEVIPTKTVIWTGGVRGHRLIDESGFKAERGRAYINKYLQAIDFENVFIIGDSSLAIDDSGKILPPTAQVTIQQSQHLVINLNKLLSGEEMVPFTFNNKGVVATVGRDDAVGFVFNKYRLKGKHAVWMKQLVNNRYLFIIGGLPLVIKKMFGKIY